LIIEKKYYEPHLASWRSAATTNITVCRYWCKLSEQFLLYDNLDITLQIYILKARPSLDIAKVWKRIKIRPKPLLYSRQRRNRSEFLTANTGSIRTKLNMTIYPWEFRVCREVYHYMVMEHKEKETPAQKSKTKVTVVSGQFVAGQFVVDNSSWTIRRGQFVARQFVACTIRRKTIGRIDNSSQNNLSDKILIMRRLLLIE